ncbi:MAG: hypothetical protein JO337_12765 [Acidimicrobiales bacterium]|nr:hypothetical protein [Acidimicrobiales bacterium]
MTAATLPPEGDGFAEIRSAARALAGAAFSALQEYHVVPPSRYRPYLQVGRDYEGGDVNVPEFARLCELLDATFPGRFGLPLGASGRDFANHWAYGFIEACIARCSRNGEPFEATATGVEESVTELLAALGSSDAVVAVCRLVSHVTTCDGAPVDLLGVHIVPAEFRGGIFEEIARHIPGGYSAFNGDDPWPMAQPLSILTVEDRGVDRYQVASALNARIGRFLRLIRLLYASTCQSFYEVRGETTLVRRLKPYSTVFNGSHALVQRTVRLSSADEPALVGLSQLLDAVSRQPADMLVTSFGMALAKFAESFQSGGWDEQIVDLTTALEGALSGSSTTDIILRLKTRAAALLAETDDPAEAIFNDIKHLYDLRSKLVHGGSLRGKDLRKRNYAISTVPHDAPAGTATAYMVDRLRDLVRRALLMRICLGGEPVTPWPIDNDEDVDAKLADDATRVEWRKAWRERLASIGAPDAAGRARDAGEFYSPEES